MKKNLKFLGIQPMYDRWDFKSKIVKKDLPAARKRPPTALRPSDEDEFVAMNKTVVPIVVAKTPEKSNKYNAHRTWN